MEEKVYKGDQRDTKRAIKREREKWTFEQNKDAGK